MAELTQGDNPLTNIAVAEILGVAESTIREDKKASQNRESDENEQIRLDPQASQNREPPPEPETPPLPEGRFLASQNSPQVTGSRWRRFRFRAIT